MKYTLLTKEQFEELHEEFAVFLASQEIDVHEWKEIKKNRPKVAEDEMMVFSDMVWDRILKNCDYVDHISKNVLNLFHRDGSMFRRIMVKCSKPDFDFHKGEDLEWIFGNITDESVALFKGEKAFSEDPESELFDLIKKGGELTSGELYNLFKAFI